MRYDKVFLVNPPSPAGYVANKDSMGGFGQLYPAGATLFPPLDLVYLASYLTENKIHVELYESLALELTTEGLTEKVAGAADPQQSQSPLMFVRTSAPTLDLDLAVCDQIKKRVPHLRIGIYGPIVPHVIWRIQKEPSVDYFTRGEPDEIVHELVMGNPEETILGLAFRKNGAWVENGERPFTRQLDTLPFPKWEMLPYKKYQLPKSSARRGHVAFLPMLTSRGCPVGCHYCPYPVGQGLPWRDRSPQNVVDEMQHLVNDLGIEYILLRDPMFSLNQKRVLGICDEVVRRGLKFEWKCETRVDFLKEETLRAMAKAGCTGVNFGVESADVDIQKGVGRKPIEPEQFRKTIALCRELGIDTFAFYIIGLPGDTLATVMKTIKFAIDAQTTWVQFTAAAPFIGTKLRAWAIAQGLTTEDEYAYISSHEVQIGNDNLTKEQVRTLHHFAQFFQNYLINRKGILKDHHSMRGELYKSAQTVADGLSRSTAQAMYTVGKWFIERRYPPAVLTPAVST
jgi:anaerobic magnesium-protoporphyrin IX monomethyl ester cyclase